MRFESRLTCPSCGSGFVKAMPLDASLCLLRCPSCGAGMRPRPGDCCVFCSFGDVPCPPRQTVVDRAREGDAPAIRARLGRAGLPTAGFRDCGPEVVVARRGTDVVGCAGLDVRSGGALLRSLAVAPDCRGHGLGVKLTEAALARARQLAVPAVYLLTSSAEQFFPRFGFEPIAREDVPASVRLSVEFTTACASTAVVMRALL
jgi:amino-acid N-acetyltransferase